MRNNLVYDLPLRVFHWLFAALFVSAFLIAKTIDDESALFSYHMLAGILLGFVVSLRLLWGFVGSKHSRFSSFALHPRDLLNYFLAIFSGDRRRWSGHNPASSWAAILMFGLALGLGTTGILMANGLKESLEDLHELLANGFLVVVLLHIAGVVLHSLRHRDGLALSMIDGAKINVPAEERISKSRPAVAILFLLATIAFATFLMNNFDSRQQTLNIFGTTLQLGEDDHDHDNENQHESKNNRVEEPHDDDSDHDD